MQRLKNKVAVVTGAGRNIGRAEAMLLAEQGAKVVVNDLGGGPYGTESGDGSIAEAVAQEIRDAGGEAVAQFSSVATREGAEATIQQAIDSFGRIDILVNNAGIVRPARIDRMTDADWTLCMDVSLTASFFTCRAAAAHMIAQSAGVIVNTGSPSGFGHWGMSNYSAAKEGLLGFTRSIARELGEFGVRANLSARFRTSPQRTRQRSRTPSMSRHASAFRCCGTGRWPRRAWPRCPTMSPRWSSGSVPMRQGRSVGATSSFRAMRLR